MPHHRAELHRSGLTDETISAAGIYSEDSLVKVKALLDCKSFLQRCLPAIVFPFTDAQGRNGYHRLKPDHPRLDGKARKPRKYESPRGQPNQAYIPPGVADLLADASRELLLTEGEKKALASTQAGFPCIGLVGVNGFKPKNRAALLPALESIAWKGRSVFIAFDSDVTSNADVQAAESQLAALLKSRGAIVKVVRLPDGEPGADGKPVKVGLDDFLVGCESSARHGRRTAALLDAAEEPEPPQAGTLKRTAAEIDAVPEATAFLAFSERDGVPRLRFWRGTWLLWRDGAYREVPPSEVRGELVDYLDRGFCKLRATDVSNVLDGLRAKARLPHRTEPPAWIGGDGPAWGSLDVVVCRNGMIHLPTLVAGKPDFLRPATPRFFTTAALDCEFRVEAPRPDAWLTFVNELWADDPESVDALQEWAGYCLTADTRNRKLCSSLARDVPGKAPSAACCGR